MQFIALIEHLILRRAAVRRSDERTVRTMDQTYRFFIRVDVLQNILDPLYREIVAHNAYQPPLCIFYFDGMGRNQGLRAGTYIRLRPIAVAVAPERTRVPVAQIVIQTVRAMRSSDNPAGRAVGTGEIIALLALIDTRFELHEHIGDVRIAIEFRTGCFEQLVLIVPLRKSHFAHLVRCVMEAQQHVEEVLLRQLHLVFHQLAHMFLLQGKGDHKLHHHRDGDEEDSHYG